MRRERRLCGIGWMSRARGRDGMGLNKRTMSAARDKFERRAEAVGSLLCVGLDPEFERIPERFKSEEWPLFAFNRWIIEQTHPYAVAYKPNVAFYEARGTQGLRELELTAEYLRGEHPEVFTI